MSPTPAVADIVPKVTTKPETLSFATQNPLTIPTASPQPSPAATPLAMMTALLPGKVADVAAMVLAVTTLASATTAPTERSKPPAMITSA